MPRGKDLDLRLFLASAFALGAVALLGFGTIASSRSSNS